MLHVTVTNWQGIGFVAFAVLYFPVCGLHQRWRDSRREKRAAELRELQARAAANARRPAPPPPPPAKAPCFHLLDIERSSITVTESGAIYARCIRNGCGQSFYVGAAVIGDPARERKWRA